MSSMKVDFGPRIGADPELFVSNKEGRITPVCGLVGGTKSNPIPVDPTLLIPNGMKNVRMKGSEGVFAYQEDNVAFEFNIPACATAESFMYSINGMIAWLHNFLATKGLSPVFQNRHAFSPLDLMHPLAAEIGCSSDNDAYAQPGRFERQPFQIHDLGLHRFCGGHIHVQYNKNNVPPHIFAQFMDVVACLPFLSWDKQQERRKFYGKPGIYRDKPYGIEYRTLSNFWLKDEFRKYLGVLGENVLQLALAANGGEKQLKGAYKQIPWYDVQSAINRENPKEAEEIVQHVSRITNMYIQLPRGLD